MPVSPTYPGVYIEEVSSGVRTITGVGTSIAAFVDAFASGPVDRAVEIFSFADFERTYGGLSASSEASYAIHQFFLNGGTQAQVVRVSSTTTPAVAAAVVLEAAAAGTPLLTATAIDPGEWGNGVRIDVDYNTTDPTKLFNITVTEYGTINGSPAVVATESFRNLVIDPAQSNDAATVVTAGSQLIKLTDLPGNANKMPAQTGTVSEALVGGVFNAAKDDPVTVTLGAATGTPKLASKPASLAELASVLQSALRTVVPTATVNVVGSAATTAYIAVNSGLAPGSDQILLTGPGVATNLKFVGNVPQYALGGAAAQAQGVPTTGQQKGSAGSWDPAADATGVTTGLIGTELTKSGMYALLDTDLFNILCIPATMKLPDANAAQIAAEAEKLCASRRAMYILDVPQKDAVRDTPAAMTTWLDTHGSLRSRNAAVYFPRVKIADPLNGFRSRTVAPSGTLAGVWASTDAARGVWKAPAGIGATLAGVNELTYKLTDLENGVLNPLAINALRTFPVYGPVSWGARTLYGADQLVDDYKYIPVRRLALNIEESLYRGTQWVVFEPNDAPLWSQIRLNVGAFMQLLFRQGAFAGAKPDDAYFVHCDDKTNPQATINLGIVNVVVGFAPLKPAEFVVIQIQQIAGQIAS
jgi:phage tail sheath protein FI